MTNLSKSFDSDRSTIALTRSPQPPHSSSLSFPPLRRVQTPPLRATEEAPHPPDMFNPTQSNLGDFTSYDASSLGRQPTKHMKPSLFPSAPRNDPPPRIPVASRPSLSGAGFRDVSLGTPIVQAPPAQVEDLSGSYYIGKEKEEKEEKRRGCCGWLCG